MEHESRALTPVVAVALFLLLVAEILAITVCVESESPLEGHWWSGILGASHLILRGAIAGGLTALLVGWTVIAEEFRKPVAWESGIRRTLGWLAAHLAAFAVFAALSNMLMAGSLRTSPRVGSWFLIWLFSLFVMLVLWAAAIQPLKSWKALTFRLRGAIACGLIVGLPTAWIGTFVSTSWEALAGPTLRTTAAILGLFGIATSSNLVDRTLGTANFTVEIDAKCSGYEGIALVWIVLTVFFAVFRRQLRFPAAWLLFPIGTGLIWLCNAARIAALIAIGDKFSPELAVGGFHSQAGWLGFNAVSLGLIAISLRSPLFSRTPPRDSHVHEVAPAGAATAAYVAPLMVLVLTMMLAQAATTDPRQAYPLRVLTVTAALFLGRRYYRDLRLTGSWAAAGVGVLVFAFWMALEPFQGKSQSSAPPLDGLSGPTAAFWMGARLLGSIVIVPLAEEIAFRGYLARRLVSTDFRTVPVGWITPISFVVTSTLFGALHGRWVAGVFAGAAYHLAAWRRGELGDAVVAHSVTNALLAAFVVTTQSWSYWD
jgi:exosortase E/protease (VPEID-CTERM system)